MENAEKSATRALTSAPARALKECATAKALVECSSAPEQAPKEYSRAPDRRR